MLHGLPGRANEYSAVVQVVTSIDTNFSCKPQSEERKEMVSSKRPDARVLKARRIDTRLLAYRQIKHPHDHSEAPINNLRNVVAGSKLLQRGEVRQHIEPIGFRSHPSRA